MEEKIISLNDLDFENSIATFAVKKRYLINVKREIYEFGKKNLYSIYLTDKYSLSSNQDCKLNEFVGWDIEDNVNYSEGINFVLEQLQTKPIILKTPDCLEDEDEYIKLSGKKTFAEDVYFSKKDKINLIAKIAPIAYKIVAHDQSSHNKELLNLSEDEYYNIHRDLPKAIVLKSLQIVNEILNIV